MIKRRQFLAAMIAGGALACTGYSTNTYAATSSSNEKLDALPAFLDTLIPEDITPSASQMDIPQKLIRHAKKITNYIELLEIGCDWLNRQSKELFGIDFLKSNQKQKNHIVSIAAENTADTLLTLFFSRVRDDSFALYYAEPLTWDGMDISRPPQPSGYLNFDKAIGQPLELI